MSEEGIKKAEALLENATRKARHRRAGITTVSGVKKGRDVVFIRNTKQDIGEARLEGYSPALKSENPNISILAADEQADGTFVVGDTVAMEIPTALRETIHKEKVERLDKAIKRVKQTFHDEGVKAGVKTFDESPESIKEATERKEYSETGKRLFAMGAGFDEKGNLVKDGKVIVAANK